MARIAAVICLLAVLSGCGGDDRADAEQTVRDFVKAVNERDAASESCKRQLKAIRGLRIRLVRIVKTEVDGDSATVKATLRRPGQQTTQTLLLEKEDGDWKLAGGAEQ